MAGIAAVLAGCVTRMVNYQGVHMSASRAIDLVEQKAERREARKDYRGAVELYASIPSIDTRSSRAPYGLLKAADLALHMDAYGQASSYYRAVIDSYAGSDYADDARIGVNVVAMREKKFTDAIAGFNAIVHGLSGERKGRAYFLLGESCYDTGAYRDAFEALAHASAHFESDKEKELARLLLRKVVRERLAEADLQQLLQGSYGTYVMSLLRLKLAQDLFSSNKYRQALDLVNAVIASGISAPDVMNSAVSLRREIADITQVDMTSVGCILPLSGDFGPYGQQVLNGIELALGLFSSTASRYTLYIMDSRGIPELAAREASELVKKDHVAAVIGPLLNSTAQEAAYKLQGYGVPMVSLSQKSDITATGDYIFQDSLTPEDQAQNIVSYAMVSLGIKQFAVLYPESTYGEDMMRAFVKQVIGHGGMITALEGYSPAETDFKTQIKKLVGTYYLDLRKQDIKKLPADQKDHPPPLIDFSAIFIPDYYEKVAMIAPQLLYYDINNVQLLGGNGWSGEGLIRMGGRYVDGAVYTDGFFTQGTAGNTGPFVDAYRSLFHSDPNILSALGYDTARIVTGALYDAVNRMDIRNNLLGIKDFRGVTGVTSYSGSRVPVKRLYLLKVHGKKIVEVPR